MKKFSMFLVFVSAVTTIWMFYTPFILETYNELSDVVSEGDRLGIVNALFSGLVLAAVIFLLFAYKLKRLKLTSLKKPLGQNKKSFEIMALSSFPGDTGSVLHRYKRKEKTGSPGAYMI